jgi:hypothetical protein
MKGTHIVVVDEDPWDLPGWCFPERYAPECPVRNSMSKWHEVMQGAIEDLMTRRAEGPLLEGQDRPLLGRLRALVCHLDGRIYGLLYARGRTAPYVALGTFRSSRGRVPVGAWLMAEVRLLRYYR